MSLQPWQWSYNGLVMGAGCDVGVTQVAGLREAPPTRPGDVNRPRQHGAWAGLTLFGERIVTLDLQVMSGATQQPFTAVLAGVASAFANILDPSAGLPALQFMQPGWATPRQVYGRPTKGGYPINADLQYGKALIPVEITCPDPLIYDTATQLVTAGLPSPTAGLAFPVGFNATFGASFGGSLTLGNSGNEALHPIFTFTGPVTWPTVTIGAASLTFQLTLAQGDTLVVDCAARTAILNGTASRAGTIATGSRWLTVPPGGATVGFSSVDAAQVAGIVKATCPAGAWGWS